MKISTMKLNLPTHLDKRGVTYPLIILTAFALSACTTTDKTSLLQNALITASDEANKTANDTNTGGVPVENTPDPASVIIAQGLDEQTMIAVNSLAVMPVNMLPVPSLRGAEPVLLAFAAAQTQISPASVASSMQFETPDYAPDELDGLIKKYSSEYDIPERLVRRVVHRESRFNPAARNGPYYGLMQISHPTARGMGYQGTPNGLLDAETNLRYAVKYLAGAYMVADGDESQAVKFYASGYYYDAKRKGLLVETGLRPAPRVN